MFFFIWFQLIVTLRVLFINFDAFLFDLFYFCRNTFAKRGMKFRDIFFFYLDKRSKEYLYRESCLRAIGLRLL